LATLFSFRTPFLNRDKKDATYKPALFRALAELATTSYHAAVWLPEGRIP
jgi:hypothetical protein